LPAEENEFAQQESFLQLQEIAIDSKLVEASDIQSKFALKLIFSVVKILF